jgi:cell division protein ZapA (FtsZ GTPase activity inhibitor)
LTEALLPLSVEIIRNLNSYNRDNLQAKASSIATIMTFEEFQKHQLKNE